LGKMDFKELGWMKKREMKVNLLLSKIGVIRR
jgi:hypothetical protein